MWQPPFRLPLLSQHQPTLQVIPLSLPKTSPWTQTSISRGPWSSCSKPPQQHPPLSPNSTPRRQPPSAALGAPASTEGTGDHLGQKETDLAIPSLAATFTQTPPWVATLHLTHPIPQLLPPTLPQTPKMEGISFILQHQTPPRVGSARLTDELLHLQERMNAALEQLLTTRATIDSQCKELELNTELSACLNEAQAIEAIKEAEVHHTATIKESEVCHATAASILQQTYQENVPSTLGAQGKGRSRVRLSSLHRGLWGCLRSLSTQKSGGTNVPPSTPDWWCAASCHFRNVSYCPAGSCIGQRNWCQQPPFQLYWRHWPHKGVPNASAIPIWPKKERRNSRTLKNIPSESDKMDGQWQRLLKSLAARLFLRSQQ